MQLIDTLGNATTLNQANFNSTGGWQTWQTTNTSEVFWLDKGVHHIRVVITLQEYNLNWFQFDVVVSDNEMLLENEIRVFPNPGTDFIKILLPKSNKIEKIQVFDISGRLMNTYYNDYINISSFSNGIYIINLESEGEKYQAKFIKK